MTGSMKTADSEWMRAINRFHVLDCLRRHEPIARIELAQRTNLSPATVSAIVQDLQDEGLVMQAEDQEEAGGRGRPRVLLCLKADAAAVLGVNISADRLTFSVANLKAEEVHALALPAQPKRDGVAATLARIEAGLRQASREAAIDLSQIAGVGIALPGMIDAGSGICHWSPLFGDGPLPLAETLSAALGVPCVMDNEARLVALAEVWFGPPEQGDNFLVVTLDQGLGMAIVSGGEVMRGGLGLGTEFGHTRHRAEGPQCQCGKRGCLEAFTADYAIARAAAPFLPEQPGALPSDRLPSERLIAAIAGARAGSTDLRGVFAEAGAALGQELANVCNLLNPTRIILAGSGVRAGDLLLEPLTAAFEAGLIAPLVDRIPLRPLPDGLDLWARGAAALVVRGLYSAPWHRRG